MRAYERLLKYVKIHTASDEESTTVPSAEREFALAKMLEKELSEIGCENVRCDEKCYVYAEIPSTKGYEDKVRLGFIAHMDTSPDFNGENVNPVITENYDGKTLKLGTSGKELSVEKFPDLKNAIGRTLITTDGTSLLGADDKAGIAEIMTAAEKIINENIPHGKICIAFTPDEEIGSGADNFDVDAFGADFAYTVDGDIEGSLEYENFNAAAARFTVNGFNVHPGSAKDVMINAALVAMEINSMLPSAEIPSKTDGYEGFYHVISLSGTTEKAEIDYIIRDHSATMYDARLETLRHIEKTLNEKYPKGTVKLEIKEQYRNMAEMIAPHKHLVDNAVKAAKKCGVKAHIAPIRGGTDGARLSFMGLPCPNLGTGGNAFHGPYEHITVEGMDIETDIITELVKIYADIIK